MPDMRTRLLGILVNADAPVWPLDIAQSIKVPYGTVYGTLRVMYDDGLVVGVTERKRTGRPARVLYRLTAKGQDEASDLRDHRAQEARS